MIPTCSCNIPVKLTICIYNDSVKEELNGVISIEPQFGRYEGWALFKVFGKIFLLPGYRDEVSRACIALDGEVELLPV